MKRTLRTILVCAIPVLTLLSAVACDLDDSKTIITPKDDDPQVPADPKDDPKEDEYTLLADAYGTAYGDYAKTGTENIYSVFYTGTVGEDGFYSGKATEAVLDLYFPGDKGLEEFIGQEMLFNAKSTCTEYTFDLGSEDDDYVYGSYIYLQESDYDYKYIMVESGCAKITVKSVDIGTQTLNVKVLMDLDGNDGNSYKFKYEGNFPVGTDEDEGDEGDDEDDDDEGGDTPGEGPAGDYQMTGINEVYAFNCGADFGGSGYDDWMIYMYNNNENEWILVELITTASSDLKIPAGTYNVGFLESMDDVKPGVCVAIAFDENDEYAYGTYYGYGEYIWYGADSGKVTVSASGDKYTVKMELVDEYENAKFGGTFTGTIACYDGSEESSSAAMAPKSFSAAKALYRPDFSARSGRKHLPAAPERQFMSIPEAKMPKTAARPAR